jgi:hypothetical protein
VRRFVLNTLIASATIAVAVVITASVSVHREDLQNERDEQAFAKRVDLLRRDLPPGTPRYSVVAYLVEKKLTQSTYYEGDSEVLVLIQKITSNKWYCGPYDGNAILTFQGVEPEAKLVSVQAGIRALNCL